MTDYAISTWLLGNLTTGDAIRLMADAGFRQAELSSAWSPLVTEWEEDPAGVCARLSDAGISVPSIHNPATGRRLDVPDNDERIVSLQENTRYIELMQVCGIPEIIIHPVSGTAGDDDEAWAQVPGRSRESLKALAEAADAAGVRLAAENTGRGGRPGSTMASLLELIDGLGEHVGICMDIGHTQQAQLDLLDELATALSADKLFTLHLHDVDETGKDHWIPGEGCLDFAPFLAMLRDHGYDRGRTLEISPAAPEEAVARIQQVAEVRDRWREA